MKQANRERHLSAELAALYSASGYRQYRMRKFEEYSLYLEHKNFLASEHVIAFNGLDGRLLAFKPDVTLSIIKNTRASEGAGEKLYYSESVFRLDRKSREYREIRQIGLEMLGDLDAAGTLEVLTLALESLTLISPSPILSVSHMGFLDSVYRALGISEATGEELSHCLATGNTHGILLLSDALGGRETAETFAALVAYDGDSASRLQAAHKLAKDKDAKAALDELEATMETLAELGYGEKIKLDFSVVSDRNYYNGIVFSGYIDGVPKAVLSGGRYDRLAEKFGRTLGAMGFAVYLSELSYYLRNRAEYDVDCLLLYDADDEPALVMRAAGALRDHGESVRLSSHKIPELRAARVITVKELTKGGVLPC